MYLKKVELKNFRLWNEALIDLEKQSTVIVGKNNTGKVLLCILCLCWLIIRILLLMIIL